MHDRRVPVPIELMQARHRRVKRKPAVEPQAWRCTVKGQGVLAAQFAPVRVAHRCCNGKPVKRTAQHDREKARVAGFGAREARKLGPGE